MDEKQINKFIGYAFLVIFASYILQMIVPFLIWMVIGTVFWRMFQEYYKHKR